MIEIHDNARYRVQSKIYALQSYWRINSEAAPKLAITTKTKFIIDNFRQLENLEDGSLHARQLLGGIEVLGGPNEETKRNYFTPEEERDF